MSYFNEFLLPKVTELSSAYMKNINDELKAAFDSIEQFEEVYKREKVREKAQKNKNGMTTLQCIREDEDDNTKTNAEPVKNTSNKSREVISSSSNESVTGKTHSKKRSKNEVDGMSSPEQDKRQKRSASVKAQTYIKKQVNVNLSQKLRREDANKKPNDRDDDKENEPILNIKIKQEKISLPAEPEVSDTESLPSNAEVKVEAKDGLAMPPPMAPVPKPRTKVPKVTESTNDDDSKRRSTRTRKQTDTLPPPVSSLRSTRASSRNTKQLDNEEAMPPPEPRPKRTRAKKKRSEDANAELDKENGTVPVENGMSSPTEKPRPKRTRRGQKAADKTEQSTQPNKLQNNTENSSPILQITKENKNMSKAKLALISTTIQSSTDSTDDKTRVITNDVDKTRVITNDIDKTRLLENDADETRVITNDMDKTRVIPNANMDETVVLPNGVFNHQPVTPKNINAMNETVVLQARETIVLEKPNAIMDATVVLEKVSSQENATDDNSLLTDDESTEVFTPPKQEIPKIQPTSAVKEKVQQFEEIATRATRTKTRAMAKKDKQDEPTDTQTPPDKIVKQGLSMDILNKMNNMIFNGKQVSSSATKPRSNIPTARPISASASKLSAINKAREEAEANKREKEDARKKKEAILEAKKELHKRKREEKMAAAAAAREIAEKERRAAMEAAVRDRMEKQAHADLGKLERLKEAERKKQELARKVAETEERRRAEEFARQKRLAEEQRKADEARRKQQEEAAAMKKEAALMEKEIEKRQKEYIEKQKRLRMEEKGHTPLRSQPITIEPVHMADGFQYLNSDEDEENIPKFKPPLWSTSKVRKEQMFIQTAIKDYHRNVWFDMQKHSIDLRDIFPNIERNRLKRTSSAVWRTPPSIRALPTLAE